MPTAIWRLLLKSGNAHCDLALAVEVRQCHCDLALANIAVRQCPLPSRTGSEGVAHCDLELARRRRGDEEEGRGGEEGEEL